MVISTSSADAVFAVGLELGDEILAYNGQRVFDTFEVQGMDAGGDPEDMVRIDVMRSGEMIEIQIPRGVLRDVETATYSVNPVL